MEMDSDSFDELRYERPKNDVFLNYLFEDIGKSFVSHLKGGLTRNSFTVFDHTMLPIGQDESSELLKAIEESEIYLVIFSIHYPFSIACLDELVLIMDSLRKYKKRKVFPIFFNVDPSHVRSQRGGSFMDGFNEHKNNDLEPDRVRKWREVLKDVGQLSGITLRNGVDEAEFILKVIKELATIQSPQDLHVTDHHVGIGSRAEELISKLRLDFRGVLVVAVFGISGIGKTTIVKSAYNRISAKFDVSCFLANIHYHCGGPNWKVDLPKLLMSCLTHDDKFSIMHHHNDDVTKLRKFIRGRKVLFVLDDVDNFQQLEALGINPKCFNNGSRIIVTTRDKHSLGYIPYTSYDMTLLNRRESLTLFTKLIFLRHDPINKEFIEKVIRRAGGLPLVLKVWSSHFKQYEEERWPNILETLKRIPHGDVQKQLQMSYDSLTNRAKKLFLDIACLFYGMKKDLVVKVLEDEKSGFFPNNEIQYLVDKSLVDLDGYSSRMWMHNAIREMGEEVVRQENEDEPGKRTRLMEDDVVRVLRDCSGTKSVEGIYLRRFYLEESETLKVLEALKKMSNLKFIHLQSSYKESSNIKFFNFLDWSSSSSSSFSFSFKKLKYLDWLHFPFKHINIDMANVVVIKLMNSKLKTLWKGFKSLKKLRILDVSMSCYLTKTGDFTGLETLEELHFSRCYRLEELHSSISCLKKLVVLDLFKCSKLKRFPWEMIGKLRSLKELSLGKYSNVRLECFKVIDPFSTLKECCITKLDLVECKISKLSHEVGNLKFIEYLNLSENRFRSLPDSLCQLHELKEIDLSDCTNLKSIPNLPDNITSIKAWNCISLVNLPSNMSELKFLCDLCLDGCTNLKSIPNLPDNITSIKAGNCISLVNLPSNMSELKFLCHLSLDGCNKLEPEGFTKVTGLKNLCCLNMKSCNVSQVSSEIGNLVSLELLDLSENTFSYLPDSVSNLSKLVNLKLNDCSQLELLPLLPSNLDSINATGCGSLDNFPSKLFQESFFITPLAIRYSAREVPEWCSYKNTGDVLSFVAPIQQHLENRICGVIICAIIYYHSKCFHDRPSPTMLNKTKETSHYFYRPDLTFESYMSVTFNPLNDKTLVVEPGDTILLQFDKKGRKCETKVLCCGLRLIYEGETVPLER